MDESLHEEATVGFACLGPRRWIRRPRGTDRWHGPSCARQARQPTHEGFAEPDCGDSDPCLPFAGFRVRVCAFSGARRTQTLNRLLGPGNRHKNAKLTVTFYGAAKD